MRVKYIKIINNTFYDDILPLDNKMEQKSLCLQHERNEASIIPIGNVCIFTCLLYLESASTIHSSKSANLVPI